MDHLSLPALIDLQWFALRRKALGKNRKSQGLLGSPVGRCGVSTASTGGRVRNLLTRCSSAASTQRR
jgi:hypothetical protein